MVEETLRVGEIEVFLGSTYQVQLIRRSVVVAQK